jgi:hypothetical protein
LKSRKGIELSKLNRMIRLFAWVFSAVVLLELVARLVSGVFVLSIDNLVARELSPLRWANGPFIYDEKLGWRLKARTQYLGQGRPDGKLSIGALGLRGASYDTQRIPQQAILAVGETQTLGANVDDDDTWPAQLASMLGELVLNGSTWNWGFDQIVLRAEELVPRLRPKTLLVALRPYSAAATDYKLIGLGYKPYFDVVDGKLIQAGVPVPLVRAQDAGWPQSLLGYSQLINSFMRTEPGLWIARKILNGNWTEYSKRAHANDESTQITCLLMDRLADLKRQHNARVMIIIEYSAGDLLPERSSEPPLVDCARARGLEVVNTDPSLRALATDHRQAFRELWQGEGDTYGSPNRAGNAFIAALVHKALSR